MCPESSLGSALKTTLKKILNPGFNVRTDFIVVYQKKVYALDKRVRVAAGSMFWQLLLKGMDTFRDVYEVHTAVTGLRDGAASRTSKLQEEMSTMNDSTSCVKVEWSSKLTKLNHI